jgi:hypothetical protein
LYLLFSIAIAGAIPLMYSTGLSKRPKIVGGQALHIGVAFGIQSIKS